MCGLAGFTGVKRKYKKALVLALSEGIDTRGGHAFGYVGTTISGNIQYAKQIGSWRLASDRFLASIASCEVAMLHSRFATSNNRDVLAAAHPFRIARQGKTALWGAHNGVLPNAFQLARENKYDILVDSQYLFELLADSNIAAIQNIQGYGAITWLSSQARHGIFLTKLSDSGQLVVAKLKEGGIVWASTKELLEAAIADSKLRIMHFYNTDTPGQVFFATEQKLYKTTLTGIVCKAPQIATNWHTRDKFPFTWRNYDFT